jgi:ERCC4-related helicase
VLRIVAQLETSGPDKVLHVVFSFILHFIYLSESMGYMLISLAQFVWFLAPTVALCLQQHEVISSQIPSVKTRILTGLDNVDRWTEQQSWDAVLQDVRVVVSTHAVLADALNHGFVRMSQLALIVFDEGGLAIYW